MRAGAGEVSACNRSDGARATSILRGGGEDSAGARKESTGAPRQSCFSVMTITPCAPRIPYAEVLLTSFRT
jgi:hypothetical protein